jgi:hypothetical protein
MAVTGQHLAADLARLMALGGTDLPQLASLYARLNREVAGTSANDLNAFGGGEAYTGVSGGRGAGGSLGDLYQTWSGLRDLLQDVLASTATSVQAAGEAVVSIARSYAETDGVSAADIRSAGAALPRFDTVDELPTGPVSVITSEQAR